MRANQLRLWFASMAYVLICALRRIGLAHTQFARASCSTIRLKLLKIGALVRTSVRRIKLAMHSAFPSGRIPRRAHRTDRCRDGLTNQTAPPTDPPPANATLERTHPRGLAKVETSPVQLQPPLSSPIHAPSAPKLPLL